VPETHYTSNEADTGDRGAATTRATEARTLVERLYNALRELDLPALEELLAPEFRGVLAPGMPFGVGGEHRGAAAMRKHGWGAIGRHFVARAEPDRFLPLLDGRMLVTGSYVGHGLRDGGPLEAPFAHIVSISQGRIDGLEQYTDTALWVAAAPSDNTPSAGQESR
jgi:2-(1,2-epoxy-1,2-dihydrophenyl)acetyl-CoA isomerase